MSETGRLPSPPGRGTEGEGKSGKDLERDGDEAPPPSPCINICRMDPITQVCEGCLRTLDEIAIWSTLSNKSKQAVIDQLPTRRSSA